MEKKCWKKWFPARLNYVLPQTYYVNLRIESRGNKHMLSSMCNQTSEWSLRHLWINKHASMKQLEVKTLTSWRLNSPKSWVTSFGIGSILTGKACKALQQIKIIILYIGGKARLQTENQLYSLSKKWKQISSHWINKEFHYSKITKLRSSVQLFFFTKPSYPI